MSNDNKAPPAAAAAAAAGGCPFRGVMQRVGLSPTSEQGQTAPGVCPFSGAKTIGGDDVSTTTTTTTTEPAPPSTSTGGVCPLGFGRSKPGGPPLSSLHCPRCKSLFHDCVLLGCGHRFCASCCCGGGGGGGQADGRGGGDCLACGADVTSRSRDPSSQALADAALEDAARSAAEGESQAWLRAAMSSAAGGNHAAALARAARSAAALEEELRQCASTPPPSGSSAGAAAAGASFAADAASRRAAVSGVIGDSYRSLGDLSAAAEKYEAAVAVLEEALSAEQAAKGETKGEGEEDPTSFSSSSSLRVLTRALTVTLNKLGDLLYSSKSAAEARPLYSRALHERLRAAGVGEGQASEAASCSSSSCSVAIPPAEEGDAECASDLIDAGLSAAKVADADATAAAAYEGGAEAALAALAAAAAEGGLRLAAALLAAGAAGATAAGGPLAARAERLRAFLESQGK